MSQHNLIPTNIKNRGGLSTTLNYNPRNEWVRNPLWLTLPTFTDGEQKVAGVFAITNYPNGLYASFKISGNYTVDWGDGTTNNYSAATTCTHSYTYSDTHLNDTDRPVTFIVSSNKVNRTAHGLTNGMKAHFYSIASTTGLDEGVAYYVINATANDFQVSGSYDGNAITLGGSDGTANLLPYKQAVITITPQGGANLTSVDLQTTAPPSGVTTNNSFGSGWLDLTFSGNNYTAFVLGGGYTHPRLERILFLMATIAQTNWTRVFANLYRLQSLPFVPLPTASGAVTISALFSNCLLLKTGPLMNTSAVTSAANCFEFCYVLRTIPAYNFSGLTGAITSAFYNCYSLEEIPALNLGSTTSTVNMFFGCSSLKRLAGLATTSALTATAGMFFGCQNLKYLPLFTTSAVTNASQMFYACSSMEWLPKFDFTAATTVDNMFTYCYALKSLSGLRLSSSVTNLTSWTYQCYSITAVPLLVTTSVTTLTNVFYSAYQLRDIPAWDVSAVTTTTNMCNTTSRLRRVRWTGMKVTHSFSGCCMAKTELQEVFTNLGTPATSQTITVTSNPGVDTAVSKTSCGTTAGSNTITQTNTVGLSTGMLVTGPNVSTNMAVTFTASTSLVNRTAHGLSNNHIVSFDTISDTTGINVYTRYYVVNATADAFQVSNTASGTALTLTTDGSGTMLYGSYINSISTNTSFTLDKPASATGTSTLTARLLDSSIATMKNWAVTF